MGLDNYIRDEIHHFLSRGGFGLDIEPLGFLLDEIDRIRWSYYDSLCVISSIIMPFSSVDYNWFCDYLLVSDGKRAFDYRNSYIHKTIHLNLPYQIIRYHEQRHVFESIIFVHAGDMNEENKRILDFLYNMIDNSIGHLLGYARGILRMNLHYPLALYQSLPHR